MVVIFFVAQESLADPHEHLCTTRHLTLLIFPSSLSFKNEECQALDAAFDRLAEDWRGHQIGLVAKVDCSNPDSEVICQEFGVLSLPLILYGDADSPEFYESEDKSYEAMSAFCKEHISHPPCNVQNLEHCGEAERAILKDLLSKPREEIEDLEERVEMRVAVVEKRFDADIGELQLKYNKVVKDYNEELDKVRKETNYKWIQQVLHHMDMQEGDPMGDEL